MKWAYLILVLSTTAGAVGCWRPYYGQTYAPPAYQQAAPVYQQQPPMVQPNCQPVYQQNCTPCY